MCLISIITKMERNSTLPADRMSKRVRVYVSVVNVLYFQSELQYD